MLDHKTPPPASTAVIPASSTKTVCVPLRSHFTPQESDPVQWTANVAFWMILGTVYIYTGTLIDRNKKKERNIGQQQKLQTALWKCQFHPASWIKSTGFTFDGYLCFNNWKYTLTSYNVVPPESPIFCACDDRDIDEVRRLFDEGLASPFDVAPNGETPLHVSGD